ncbi:MAG: carboxypeptidase-like regulatory domain-containing protein, partial [Gammaproteobacteria bacterium]
MKVRNLPVLRAAVLLAACAALSLAQSTTSQIHGIVKDPSGASIAGAQVTVTNQETGIARSVASNELGYYTVALLQPGSYKIVCNKAGFRQLVRTGITLAVDQAARVDLSLELGDVTQSIEVRGDAALLEADRPESSTVIITNQFDRLPLIQQNRMRNPVGFIYMTPRVQGNVLPDGSDHVGATTQMRFGGGQQFESE